jgi:hypothetical protein
VPERRGRTGQRTPTSARTNASARLPWDTHGTQHLGFGRFRPDPAGSQTAPQSQNALQMTI